MKQKLLVLLFFVLSYTTVFSQGNIYIWSEIHPGWKNHSLEYWATIKGYGKSLPQELSALITEDHLNATKKLELSIKQAFLRSGSGITPVFTDNPGSIRCTNNDYFLDISCHIAEVSELYPYFRTRKLKIEPRLIYSVSLYNSGGEIIFNREYTDSIQYKEDIRPHLRGMSEYRRDVEIVLESYMESFSGQLPLVLLSDLDKVLEKQAEAGNATDPEKFTRVITLLFENRKLSYPDDYKKIEFQNTDIEVLSGEQNRRSDDNTNRDKLLSSELNSLIEGSRYFALIIGINEYADPNINDLSEPLLDASGIYTTLNTYYTFEKENIRMLKNPTRDELIRALDNLAYEVSEKDNLLIFYAGHGLWDDQLKKGFWIPSNASTDNRSNWFSNSDLRDYIGGIKAKHTLLISDACFSGGIFKTREAFSAVTPATLELYKLSSRKAMTSGAMTTVPDKSIFIEYLLRRLTENTSPVLSSEQLFASFKIAVINNSPTKQVPQFGEIRETGDEGGDFLFIRRY